MYVLTTTLLAVVFLSASTSAQYTCADCSSITAQMTSCSSTADYSSNSCLSAICSQKFFNSYGACMQCTGGSYTDMSSISMSLDSIIQSCRSLQIGGNLCNPLKTGSNCPGYAPFGGTTSQRANSPGGTTPSGGTATSAPQSTDSGNPAPIGAIVGGVIGGVVLIGAVAIIAYRMAKRKSVPTDPALKPPPPPPPVQNMQYGNQYPQQQQSYASGTTNSQPYPQYYGSTPTPPPPSQPPYGQPTQYNNFSPSPSQQHSQPPPQYNSPMTILSPYAPNNGSDDGNKSPYAGPVVVEYEGKNATIQRYDHAGGGTQQNHSGTVPDAGQPIVHDPSNLYKPNA